MKDKEHEGEMPTGAMEEVAPAGAMPTPAKMAPEDAGEAFMATAKIPIPEFIGVVPQEGPAAAEALRAAEPSVGKMPGE